MKIRVLFFVLLLVGLPSLFLFAQKNVVVFSEMGDILPSKYPKLNLKTAKNINSLQNNIPSLISYYHHNGYYACSLDSIVEDSNSFKVYLYCGKNYSNSVIQLDSLALMSVEESKVHQYCRNGVVSYHDYDAIAEKIIEYYEQCGYPFTQVFLRDIQLNKDSIVSTLTVEKKRFITFDSIVLKGNIKLSRGFLYPYLGLRKNRPYNERTMLQVPSKIAQLPFVVETRPSGIEFVEDKAYLYLFIDKVKMNRFDGYLGIVPVNESSGKVSVNGELNLNLINIFTLGESLDLMWRSTERYSQNLKVHGAFPFLFRTPLGLNGSFILDKKDTSYLNLNYLIAVQYSFTANNNLKVYFDYTSSSVLSSEMVMIDDSLNYVDYRKQMYGVELFMKRLDRFYNPQKGYSFLINASAGRRAIIQNSQVASSVYQNLNMNSLRYRLMIDVKGYVPLHKSWVMAFRFSGASLIGEELTLNELFRIGGASSLQGFDEESILASTYAIASAELRFLFSKRSYINAFFNAAGYEQHTSGNYYSDYPFGFGIGISFDTKAGIFYLSYSLGKQQNCPISLKSGKIHFGLSLGF